MENPTQVQREHRIHLDFTYQDGMHFYQALCWYACNLDTGWFDEKAFELAEHIIRQFDPEKPSIYQDGYGLFVHDYNFNTLVAAVEQWREYLDNIDRNKIRLDMRSDLVARLRQIERTLVRQHVMEEIYG